MSHPFHHALSSARKWGGKWQDYIAIHNWFDESKQHCAVFTHRALRHHAEGIFEAERVFGVVLPITDKGRAKLIPVRWVGEQHVKEDLGRIPTLADWLRCVRPEPWMSPQTKIELELKSFPMIRTEDEKGKFDLRFCSLDCRGEYACALYPGRSGRYSFIMMDGYLEGPNEACHNCGRELEAI